MAGRVAQAFHAVDRRKPAQQGGEAQRPAPAVGAVIGIDVLTQQRQFDGPVRRQPARLGNDLIRRPRELGTARIRHNTEGAELVATFLDRHKGGRAARRRLVGQEVELRFDGKLGVKHTAAGAARAGHHFGQAVVGLRPQHDVDMRGAAQHLGALGLGDATGYRKHHRRAGARACRLQPAQPTELGKHLLGGLFADMTGVQDHHVGIRGALARNIAQRRQDIRHTRGVVDVHLAAVSLDEEFLGQSRFADARVSATRRAVRLPFPAVARDCPHHRDT